MTWSVGRIAVFLAVLVTAWCVIAYAAQRRIVFPRSLLPPASPTPQLAADVELLTVEIGDGHVEAFFLPGMGVSSREPGPAVLYFHGNGELIDMLPEAVRPYRELGMSVLLVEYRGYGRSAGEPSEADLLADALAFRGLLVARPEVDHERLVYHGTSLGGGVACGLAAQRPPAALVLVSTFRSLRAMASGFLVPSFLVRDPFDNEVALAGLEVPVLLMHGRRDGIVPFEHGEALAALVGERATFVPWPGSHNALTPDRSGYWRAIGDFLRAAAIVPAES